VRKLSLIFFIISFAILLKVFFLGFYPDFNSYYHSGIALNLGINPYMESSINFLYPPLSLVLLLPLKFLPYSIASFIWLSFSIAAIYVSILFYFKINNRRINSALGFLVLGLTFFSFPVKFTLGMGQINAFILLLVVLALYFLEKKKLLFSSVFIVLSLLLKIFPILLPLYFLITKNWKALIFLFLLAILISLIPIIVLGSNMNLYFYEKVLPTLINGWKIEYYNQSLTGFVGRLIVDSSWREYVRFALTALFVFSSSLIIFKTRVLEKMMMLNLSFLITLGLIISNFSWQHHFIFTIIPFIATLFIIIDKKLSPGYLIILFISYLLISLNIKDPGSFPVLIQSHVFYGIILLWGLQGLIIWKEFLRLRPNSAEGRQR
jgi:hypothetical protein